MQKLTHLNREAVNSRLIALFGEPFRVYREEWDRVERERGGYVPPMPLHLDLEIDGRCNLKCQMCFRGVYGDQKHSGLGREILQKVFKECAGRTRAVLFGFNDEPLMDREKCFWAIEEAVRHGFMDIFMGTNALKLDQAAAEQLIRLKVSHLTVSIDAASDATYERLRGRDGYRIVTENLLGFLKLRERLGSKIPFLRVSFVDMSSNRSEKEAFMNYWRDKADEVLIQGFIDLNKVPESLSREQLDRLKNSDTCCLQPFRRLSIDADGQIHACCCFISGKEPLGNIHTDSLEGAWNGERARTLRDRLRSGRFHEIPACLRCQAAALTGDDHA